VHDSAFSRIFISENQAKFYFLCDLEYEWGFLVGEGEDRWANFMGRGRVEVNLGKFEIFHF
jgi:hypothetical protein